MSHLRDAMTTTHPRWDEFIERLDQAVDEVGCEARGDRGQRHENAIAILATMDVDVPASLTFFRLHGGRCDCEILMNVDRGLDPNEDLGEEYIWTPVCPGPPIGCERCRDWLRDDPTTQELVRGMGAAERAYLNALK